MKISIKPNTGFNRLDSAGLSLNIAASAVAALLIDGFIALVNPGEMSSHPGVNFEPPSYIIGCVWVLLFACLGASRWLVLRASPAAPEAGLPIVYLGLFCLAYPFFTIGLSNIVLGLAGNVAVILVALRTALQVRHSSSLAAALIWLLLAWVVFATGLIVERLLS